MAQSTDLIVDEEYLQETADYIMNSGYLLEKSIHAYLTILKDIRNSGIKQGEIAEALSSFIQQAERLKGIASSTANEVHDLISYYLGEIKDADNFRF